MGGGIADFQVWKGWMRVFCAVLYYHVTSCSSDMGGTLSLKEKKNISTGLSGEPAASFLGAEVGPYCREFRKGNIIKTRLK